MSRRTPSLIAALLGLAACTDAVPTSPARAASDGAASVVAAEAPARFVILMRGNAAPGDLAARVEAAGGFLVSTLPQVGLAIATSANAGFAAAMRADARVQDVGDDVAMALPEAAAEFTDASLTDAAIGAPASAPTAADDLFNGGLLWGISRVGAPAAWAAGNAGDGADIGIIDTGIASNHPDLAANVVFMACYTSQATCNPYPTLSDHGTHVAGTVAAVFGGGRVVGVAPMARLHSYNTFEFIPGCGTCSYSSSRWLAMVDAADRGLDAINMSLGSLAAFGGRGSDGLATFVMAEKRVANYVTQRGTVLVASAGNSNVDLNGTLIAIPGDVPGVVTVGSSGIRPQPRFPFAGAYDVRSFFSNYGAGVSLVAPGGDCGVDGGCPATRPANWFEYLVLSTIVAPNAACGATQSCAVGYGWKAGTSMAAPHVAGAVALARAQNPSLNAFQVAAKLTRTAQSIGDRQQFGAGMLNAAAMAQ